MTSRLRRLGALVGVWCALVALGAVGAPSGTVGATSGRAPDPASLTARSTSRAPIDGVAPTAAARPTDATPGGRSRTRWAGELLATLALAVLVVRAGHSAVGVDDGAVVAPSPGCRPALGRAPPGVAALPA